MQSEEVDVVVIGGGPAGAVYAAVTARSGLRVRVLEGTEFPRHHIGESLLAMSMPLLRSLGVTADLEAAGFLPKTGAVFVWGERRCRIDLSFPAPHEAFQVHRGEFDDLLLRHATRSGAAVWQRQWAKSVVSGPDGRIQAVVSDGGHGPTTHHARLVVDASGLFQFLPRRLGLGSQLSGPRRVAVSGYYRGAARVTGDQATNIISEAARDGWLWFIPLDADTTSVGFVGDDADMDDSPAEAIAEQIGTSSLISSLLEGASPTRTPRLLRYTNHIVADPLWRDGRLLIGDTALFVDPLFSTGVHGALYGGMLAAAATVSVLKDGMAETELADWYDKRMRAHYERVQSMVRLLYGITGDAGRFWQSRSLAAMTDQEARELARALGPISVPLFKSGHEAGTLDLPPALIPLLEEFHTEPDPAFEVDADRVVLREGIEVSRTLIRRGDRVVRAVAVVDPENRRPTVEVPEESTAARLINRLSQGPVTRPEWRRDARLAALISVLYSGGLVRADVLAGAAAGGAL